MGCSTSIETLCAVEKYGNEFAILYIKHVLGARTAKITIISKLFHLLLFLKIDGENAMYDTKFHKVECFRDYCYRDEKRVEIRKIYGAWECNGELSTLFCCIACNTFCDDILRQNHSIEIDFNVNCHVLNQYVKKHALAELAIQQQKLIDFTPKTVEFWKTEILRIERLIANNNNIMENEENHNRIAQIYDENVILHKQLNNCKDMIKNSEFDCNKIDTVNANIAKLQRLCKILVCEKLTDSNVVMQTQPAVSEAKTETVAEIVLPIVPTATPIVYPIAPTNMPIGVASYVQPTGEQTCA